MSDYMLNDKSSIKWGHMFLSGDVALQATCDGCDPHCLHFSFNMRHLACGHLLKRNSPIQGGSLAHDHILNDKSYIQKRGECWYSRRSHTPFLVGSIPILATSFNMEHLACSHFRKHSSTFWGAALAHDNMLNDNS